MDYTLLLLALLTAALNWVAVEKKWKWLEYLAKPGMMLLLLAFLVQNGGYEGPLLWFFVGGIFSLLGDVLLMLPWDLFIFGLVAFLLGHLAYIMGFNQSIPALDGVSLLYTLLVILILGITAQALYRHLAAGLLAKGTASLKMPVLVYAIVITLMVISALLCFIRPDWEKGPTILACMGAILFFCSDSMLAWNRFVSPVSHDRLKVMTTYHLGQVGILLGAALNFLN